ncbi:MAG: energy-coupling factor transporter ATPase, partial [Bacteroidaceae bacterium]|nr:energy-coupling factor transporter ATPase [Bacteroidaceae bacterium]
IVMNKGRVAFDDIPKEVFKHYKELEEIGLAAPQVTYVMQELKEAGFDVDTQATTLEEAKIEILKAFGKC